MAEPFEMPFGLRTLVIAGTMYSMEVQIPHGKGQFFGLKGRLIVKYRETLRSSIHERLNRSRCRLGCGFGCAQGSCVRWGPHTPMDVAMATNFWLSMGYNFGCMIAIDMLFDSMGGFRGSS